MVNGIENSSTVRKTTIVWYTHKAHLSLNYFPVLNEMRI